MGAVFSGTTEKVDQRQALSIGACGSVPQSGPHQSQRSLDFYDLKGVVEQLLSRFKFKSTYFDISPAALGITPSWLHPYRAARIVVEGLTIGWFGQLHPRAAADRKLKDAVYVGELYLDRLLPLPAQKPLVREISRYQLVRRDFSLRVPNHTNWAELDACLATLSAQRIPELVDWRVREVLRTGQSEEYSMLLGTTFQAQDRTLRDEELQGFSQRVIEAVSQVGARLRS
jgi:phenylalanyl-tRNA synthetase beta chain